jgi:hypothetical protein
MQPSQFTTYSPPVICGEKLVPTVPQKRETVFSLESLSDWDPALPKPRNKAPEKKKASWYELDKLQRTFALGGLVPERSSAIDVLAAKAPPQKPICVPPTEPLSDTSIN